MRWFFIFILVFIPSLSLADAVNVDSPPDGALVTGADSISGWTCDATSLQIRFDDGALITLPYGGTRGDTMVVCGDDDNGFSLPWNWALNGPGQHTIEILKDGVVSDTRTVTVINFGVEFLTGVTGVFNLPNFPSPGQSVDVEWREDKQNFTITDVLNTLPAQTTFDGTWNISVSVQGSTFLPAGDCEGGSSQVSIQNSVVSGSFDEVTIAGEVSADGLLSGQFSSNAEGFEGLFTATISPNNGSGAWVDRFGCWGTVQLNKLS